MATTHPELAAQWHPTLNGEITPHDVMASTNRKYWWQCDVADDHVWDAPGNKLVSGRGCPFCAGKRVAESNCMATTHPELAAQWHPTLNGDISPRDVAPKSNKSAWWKCDAANDHVWQASIASRSDGRGCPYCTNRRVCESNCMATTHPHIARQLHPTLNGDINAHNIVAGTGKKLWWRCYVHENHAWQRSGASRVQHQGSGCPYC